MQPDAQHVLNHPLNNIIFHSLMACTRVLVELERDGLEVIGIDVFGKRTTIHVRNSEVTQAMILAERACYYRWQKADGEYQRFGQFQVEKCRVIWVERGH